VGLPEPARMREPMRMPRVWCTRANCGVPERGLAEIPVSGFTVREAVATHDAV